MEYQSVKKENIYQVTLSGNFTFSDSENFRKIINAVEKRECENLILDINKINFIDSAALGMLLLLREKAEQARISLTINNPNQKIKKIFKLSQFDHLFTIV